MNWKHVSKKVLKWSAVAIGVLVLCLALIFVLLQTDEGRKGLARMAMAALSEKDRKVEIGSVTGLVPFRFQVESLNLSDDQGVLFKIENLEIDWAPLALLRGDIRFRTLRCTSFHLNRLPQETNSSLRLPPWLVFVERLKLERLAISELVAGESVLGEKASFRVEGDFKAALPGREWAARLAVDRIDGPEAKIRMDAKLRENGRFLILDLDAHEAQGGLFSRHANIAGPVAIKIHGEGPDSLWKGIVEMRAGGGGSLSGHFTGSFKGSLGLESEGTIELDPGIRSPFVDLPAGEVRFSMKGRLENDRRLEIAQLSLESGDTDIQLSGASDLREGKVNANVKVRLNRMKMLERAFSRPLSGWTILEGNVSGSLLNPALELQVESGDLGVDRIGVSHLAGEMKISLGGSKRDTAPEMHFEAHGAIQGLNIREVDFQPERDFDWALSGGFAGGRVLVESLALKGKKDSLHVSGEFFPSTGDGKLEVDAEAKDLHPLMRKVGLDIPGSGRIKGSVKGDFKTLSLTGEIHAQLKTEIRKQKDRGRTASLGRPLRSGEKRGEQRSNSEPEHVKAAWVKRSESHRDSLILLYPLLKESSNVGGTFSLEQGRKIRFSEIRFTNPAASFTAAGELDLQKRQGRGSLQLQIPDLKPWSRVCDADLRGSLQANSTVDANPGGAAVRAEILGREVQSGKLHLGPVLLALNGNGSIRANDGFFRLEAGEEDTKVSGEAHFSTRGRKVSLASILLRGPGNTSAKGNFDLDLDSKLAQGRLSGQCPDLAPFSDFVSQALKGKLQFDAELGKSNRVQQVKLSFSGTNLKAASLDAEQVRLQATLTEMSGNPRGAGTAECRNVKISGMNVSSLGFKFSGDGSKVSFDANGKGSLDRTFGFETRGTYQKLESGANLTITRLQGTYGRLPFRLQAPLPLKQAPSAISADAIQLILGPGHLNGAGRLGPDEIRISLNFENLPLDLMRPAEFPLLEGTASGDLSLQGRVERPEGTARIRIAGLRGGDPQLKTIPPASLEAFAGLRDQRLRGEITLRGVTSRPFVAVMDIPVQFSRDPYRVSFPRDRKIKGELNGKADLARLGVLLGMDDQGMSGVAEVDLHLEGSPEHPQISGTIGVDNGGYENARSGTIIKEANVRLNAGATGLVIERASASDGEEGSAFAEGRLEMDPEKGFPFQVDVVFQKLKIVRHDWVTAKGKGQIRLKGSFARAVLSGEVQVDTGEFRIPERLPQDTPELDVVEINEESGVKPAHPEKPRKSDPFLDFALRVKTPGRFFVRGRGLDSEWAGELRLTGPAEAPDVEGELAVQRGRFNFLDRRFALTDGKITFNGPAQSSPFLDVQATASAKEVTAKLHLVGPARSPEIKLSSEPLLPSDEILSRLLFGQGMSRISPLQAIQLAQTLNSLGGKNTLDLMGTTRKLLRIDQLEVKQSADKNNDPSIAAGKYLRDNVYLEVERSLGPGGTKASVQWEFSPHLNVETEIGADAQSGVGISWKWDY